MSLTQDQYVRLLANLDPDRVKNRDQSGMKFSYLEQWDVRVHLNRFFGFGGWGYKLTNERFVFEQEVISRSGNPGWEVAYQVTLQLEIYELGCMYTESAVGSAIGSRAEAHDNAVKNAASDALKRAAMNLGTQFGLSLYDKGSTKDVIKTTLRPPTD